MEIQIDHTLLSDAPLLEGPVMQLRQVTDEFTSFVEDLSQGNPSCYLVSGYRGAGKTSFVKSIEKQITGSSLQGGVQKVFVYVNFSRYTEPKFARRQIIRALHNKLLDSTTNQLPEDIAAFKNALELLGRIYEKTFWETSSESVHSTVTEVSVETQLDYMQLGLTIVALLFGAGLLADAALGNAWLKIISGILFFGVSGLSGFYWWKKKRQHKTANQQEDRKKTLYDDEIADYYLEQILDGLKKKYKIIFVFDELDKLETKKIDGLFEDIKFLLISGHASFVMVAGQELYYKYAYSSREDDALLSSLFARHIHISLISREAILFYFDFISHEIRLKVSGQEKQLIDAFIDNLIFRSRRIPRKFINLIRQQLDWADGKAVLQISDNVNNYEVYSIVLNCIEQVDNTMIASERYDKALQDYFVMQLFEKAQQMIFDGKRKFTLNDIAHQ